MCKEIKKYCENCNICKLDKKKFANYKTKAIVTRFPNEIWEVDLIGALKSSNNKKFIILMCINHYTKYVEAKLLLKKDTVSTAKAIEELIIKKHGISNKIFSDSGLEFKNDLIKKMANKYNFKWIYSAPDKHQATGAIEITNQTFLRKLRALINYKPIGWESKINRAAKAINLFYHRGIKTYPYLMRFGKIPMLNIDKNYNINEKFIDMDELRYKRNLHIEKYLAKDIKKGKKDIQRNFKNGDLVVIFRDQITNKLECKWKEGAVICGYEGENSYVVKINGRKIIVHKKHCRKL